jgi:hypothetical protein
VSREHELDALMSALSELPTAESNAGRALRVRERCHASLRRRGGWRSLIANPSSLIFKQIPDPGSPIGDPHLIKD